jgi:hypothetical protein
MLPEVDQLATVVVCEDDEATLELLCDHLTADRYRALAAPSASDALRLCHFKQPEALLLVARNSSAARASWVPSETPGLKRKQASIACVVGVASSATIPPKLLLLGPIAPTPGLAGPRGQR